MDSQVAILVPVLGRPHRVVPFLTSVIQHTRVPHRVAFIPDPDDHTEIHAIYKAVEDLMLDRARYGVLTSVRGNYAAKINAGCALTDEPYVFTGADDLRFHRGWFEKAVAHMLTPGARHWVPNRSIGVVGTNDLCNRRTIRGEHSTHTLVARWYIDEQGTIDERGKLLHEGYVHEFVDDELVATARHRGMWAHAGDSLVEHLHPMCGKCADPDALQRDPHYGHQRRRIRRSRELFHQRSALWT